MRSEYVPKGSMCMLCEHRHEDCSDLDFESMRPLVELSDGTVIVRCDSFERGELQITSCVTHNGGLR